MTKITCIGLTIVLSLAMIVGNGSIALGRQTKNSSMSAKRPTKAPRSKSRASTGASIVTAVKAAAEKDCGCGECAAKGCEPCHGKNCYYCVAKALVVNDCGCQTCDAGGCQSCGPGCDVCKFHLAPNAAAKGKGHTSQKKK